MDVLLLNFSTKFFLDNSPIDMEIVDTTDYSATAISNSELTQPAIIHTQVEGIVDARLPNGNLFYDGDATFTSPDIDRDVTDTFSGTPITLDANGNMIEGLYVLDYTIEVTDERFDFPVVLIDFTGGKGIIQIRGDYRLEFADQTLVALSGTSGGNDGTLTFETINFNAATDISTIQVSETLTPEGAGGTLELTATRQYVTQRSYDFTYTASEACITVTADCDMSELTSTDATNYDQYDTAGPSSRNHIIHYPVDLDPPIGDIDQLIKIISVNPIYTNIWTTELRSTVLKTGSDGLVIQDEITGVESFDVQCDDELCTILTSLEAVAASFDRSLTNNNQKEIQRWGNLWDQVKGYFILYDIARSCGDRETQTKYFNLIVAAIAAEGCVVATTKPKSAVSVIVQSITAGGLTTIYNELVNQWFTGTAIPSDSLHDNGDFYLQTAGPLAGSVYQKVAGTWGSPIINLNGADGNDGNDGGNGTNGTNGTTILFSDANQSQLAGGPFANTKMPNRSYIMPSGTLANGDSLHIVVEFWRQDFAQDGFNVSFGTFLFELGLSSGPAIAPPVDMFTFIIEIIRLNATTVKALWRVTAHDSQGQAQTLIPTQYGLTSGGSLSASGSITVLDLDANTTDISLQVNSDSNTITSQLMRIDHLTA